MANNETKRPVGRPTKERNEEHANMAKAMAQYGVPQEDIACVLGICVETLQRLYGNELSRGKAIAKQRIGRRLFEKAVTEGDTTALIFMAKTQLGWREVNRTEVTSPDGSMSPMQDIKVTFIDPDEVKKGKK